MTAQRVTIKDLARELGISTSTVSRALRGHNDINKNTMQEVRDLAHRRGYEPDIFALMLKRQTLNTIGILVPKISHYFFASFVSEVQDVANQHGFHTIVCQSYDNYEREASILQGVFSTRIDGLAIALSKETEDMKHIQRLQKRNMPIVFFDRASNSIRGNTVISDDYSGAQLAVEHLWEQGYRKIAYISANDPNLLINEVREDGYREAIEMLGGATDERWVVKTPEASMVHGLEAALYLLSLAPEHRPDAIFAADDHLALGVVQAAKAKGMNIPNDIGLVGYGNAPLTQWTSPSITTIKQSSCHAGALTFELLHKQINQKQHQEQPKPFEPECHILPSKLIARESSQKE